LNDYFCGLRLIVRLCLDVCLFFLVLPPTTVLFDFLNGFNFEKNDCFSGVDDATIEDDVPEGTMLVKLVSVGLDAVEPILFCKYFIYYM
jgi:hypothetical protein